MAKLTYHGHACFSLEDDTYHVLIDPFLSGNPLADVKPEDLKPTHILVTHGHGDHLGDALELAKANGALIIAPNELAIYCGSQGAQYHAMHIGGSYKFPFGRVKLTPAWHGSAVINEGNILYTGCPCGFIVEFAGKVIYHAGDTGLCGDMRLIGEYHKPDYALLPIGDNYVMGPEDALRAASMLQAKLTVPIHYNTFPVIKQDPHAFVAKLQEMGLQGRVLEPGQSLTF